MDKAEARQLLRQHLDGYRTRGYGELAKLVGQLDVAEVAGASATSYQIEVQVLWDDKPHRDIRVMGGIDDGGLRAFLPLTDSFIMAPDGSFVGE